MLTFATGRVTHIHCSINEIVSAKPEPVVRNFYFHCYLISNVAMNTFK